MDEIVDEVENIPVYLKISIVEPILLECINESNFSLLLNAVQNTESTNENILKKYLFHLITSNFVKYNGKRKIFTLSQSGSDLLQLIYIQIQRSVVNYQDLTVKVD